MGRRLETSRIRISVASPEDAELLAGLGARTFRDTFAADNTEADMDAYLAGAFGAEIQAAELADDASTFLIAFAGVHPAGYARMRSGAAPDCIAGARTIEIVRFYADTPWIGRGVGSALMQACLDFAVESGSDTVWLDVWERNPRAIAFYRKRGFVVVGEQSFQLGDDEQHDLLMARPVPAEGARDRSGLTIRPATADDFADILRLNTEWVHFTSHLDEAALADLHAQSPYHCVVTAGGHVIAFLLALREGCDYASPNYRWFSERGGPFLYIDRVIVDSAAHGKGVARMLYDDVVAFARVSGVGRVVCELDIEPPNEASRRFHDGYGFTEIGRQWVAGGTKRVSLRELTLR